MQVDGKARPDAERAFTRDALFAMDQDGLPSVSQWLDNSLVNQTSFEQLQRTLKLGREALHSEEGAVQHTVPQQPPPSKSAGFAQWRAHFDSLLGKPRKQYHELSKDLKRSKQTQATALLGSAAELLACAVDALGKQSKEQQQVLADFCIEHCASDTSQLAQLLLKRMEEAHAEQRHSRSVRGSPAGKRRALSTKPVNVQQQPMYRTTAMMFHDLDEQVVRKIVINVLRWKHKRYCSQDSFQDLRNTVEENSRIANVPNIFPTKQHISNETAIVRKANHATRDDLIRIPEHRCVLWAMCRNLQTHSCLMGVG